MTITYDHSAASAATGNADHASAPATRAPRNRSTPLQYDPSRLLDTLRITLEAKNDAALARLLGLSPPVISKVRHQQIPVGASVLIRLHEVTGMSIAHLRALMGDRRKQFRIGVQPVLVIADQTHAH